jgi:TorA maturation chaperone TorD
MALRRQPLALAWSESQEAACNATVDALAHEYQALFIGPTRGEPVRYGSCYLTGFLTAKPLALLRAELAELRIQRRESVRDAKNHAAAVRETMSLLVEAGGSRQADFFDRHLAPWLGRFFHDLRQAEAAGFYRAVGGLGEAFFEVERVYLEMPPS